MTMMPAYYTADTDAFRPVPPILFFSWHAHGVYSRLRYLGYAVVPAPASCDFAFCDLSATTRFLAEAC